jgi:N utilization substance protein B
MTTKPRHRPGSRRGRSTARLAAVQSLYEIEMSGASVDEVLLEALRDRWRGNNDEPRIEDPDKALFAELVRGVTTRRADLDAMVAGSLAADASMDRMEKVLQAIARAGAYELLAHHDVPAKVVIDEYVSLAHAFFDGGEPKLINAVLDRLARTLRPGEFEAQAHEQKAG